MTEEDDRQRISQDILKDVRVGRDLTVGNITQNITHTDGREQPTRSRSEILLLDAVKKEVISRLDQSLHNAVFINLGKQPQPQQVKRPWDAEIKIGSQSPKPLPAETSILEVFDRSDIAGRLLILGEPGAGKTTTMLDLAKGLCDRAEQDTTAFIPVLLNLASWKDPKQMMTAWLVAELKSKYGVRKDIGTKWLAEKLLLPLLDGLDEVKPEHLESCVQAINRWLASDDRPLSLAVCCRREEYEKVVRGRWQVSVAAPPDETRIHLDGAILLQPLTTEQVARYLIGVNKRELWRMVKPYRELRKLVETPLWLSITLLSYEDLSLNQWQQTASTEQRLSLLLDAYIERMLCREIETQAFAKPEHPSYKQAFNWLVYQARFAKLKPPRAKQTRQWLIWLSRQMDGTEFLIEEMQPHKLPVAYYEQYKRLFWLKLCLLFGLAAVLIFGLICVFNMGLSKLYIELLSTLFLILFFAVLTNGIDSIKIIEKIKWSKQKVKNGLLVGSTVGLILGLLGGFLNGFGDSNLCSVLTKEIPTYLIEACFMAIPLGMLFGIFEDLNIKKFETTEKTQRIWNWIKLFVRSILALVLFKKLFLVLIGSLDEVLFLELLTILCLWLTCRFSGSLGSAFSEGKTFIGKLEWAIDYRTRRQSSDSQIANTIWIIFFLILGISSWLLSGLSENLSIENSECISISLIRGVEVGLMIGLVFGSIGGLFSGGSVIEVEPKMPNQGIWNSAKNSLLCWASLRTNCWANFCASY